MTDKYWVKFDGFDVVCISKDRCCCDEPTCKEHIVRFTEINRDLYKDEFEETSVQIKGLERKFKTELEKSIKALKRIKV